VARADKADRARELGLPIAMEKLETLFGEVGRRLPSLITDSDTLKSEIRFGIGGSPNDSAVYLQITRPVQVNPRIR
jgi:hypothetical protein